MSCRAFITIRIFAKKNFIIWGLTKRANKPTSPYKL